MTSRPLDPRLQGLLQSLLLNINVINDEITRMLRTEQFTASSESQQLIKELQQAYQRGNSLLALIGRKIN